MSAMSKEQLLVPSAQFKKEVTRSIISIIGFILVYFLLFALSIGLVVASFYGGIAIMTLRVSFYTLLIGIGLMGFTVMVVVFLIKFLFATSYS